MSIIKTTISVRDTIETPSPIIGSNGNWWVWDTTQEIFVDTGVKAKGEDGKDVDPAQLDKILSELGNTKSLIQALEKATKKLKEGKLDLYALPYHLRWLLDAFNNGETTLAGGLILTRIIGLGNQSGRITAQLSGYNNPEGKVLRAGIDYNVQRVQSSIIDYLRSLGFDTGELSSVVSARASFVYSKLIDWAKKQPNPYEKLMADIRGQVVAFPNIFKLTDKITITHPIDTGREKVAIHHDGKGHFGDIYLQGNRIDYKVNPTANPYLSVGSADAEFIDDFISGVRTDDTPINESKVELKDGERNAWIRTFEAIGDDTKVTITIDKLIADVYKVHGMTPGYAKIESFLQLSLDNEIIASWQGSESPDLHPLPIPNPLPNPNPFELDLYHNNLRLAYKQVKEKLDTVRKPAEASNLVYTLYVPKGTHTLKLAIVGNNKGGSATIENIRLSRYFDSGATQTYIRGSGLRFFASADRYVDVDYRDSILKIINRGDNFNSLRFSVPNPYTMRVKGGLKVDRIQAEEIDMPGGVLCGGAVKGGSVKNSFGKYKNKYNSNEPYAKFNRTARIYTVHHSIGHTNYVPMITMTQGVWNDLPHVVSVDRYSFDVKFINGENVASEWAWDFNYVCYKGE